MELRKMIQKVLKEESSVPSFIKRRNNFTDDEIKKNLKKFAIRVFEPNKKMDYIRRKRLKAVE
jgi:hypothetical protein